MRDDKVLVVFDGTSAYVIPDYDLNGEEILGSFYSLKQASIFCEQKNEEIQGKIVKP